MNDCPNGDLRDLLPDLLHDRLSAGDRALVESHLAGCGDCRAELELLRELRGTMRGLPAVSVRAIVAAIPPYRAPVRRSWGGWRAAAAVALIAVGGTSVAIANRDTVRSIASAPTTDVVVPDTARIALDTHSAAGRAPATASRELAVGGTVADLSDQELSTLLDGIESLDALPSAEAENAAPVTPVAPVGVAREES